MYDGLPMVEVYKPEKMEAAFGPGSNSLTMKKNFHSLQKRLRVNEICTGCVTILLIALAVIYFFNIPVSSHQSGRMVIPEMQQMYGDCDDRVKKLEDRLKHMEDLLLKMNDSLDSLKRDKVESERNLEKKIDNAKEEMNDQLTNVTLEMRDNTTKWFEFFSGDTNKHLQLLNTTMRNRTSELSDRLLKNEARNINLTSAVKAMDVSVVSQQQQATLLSKDVRKNKENNDAILSRLDVLQQQYKSVEDKASLNHSAIIRQIGEEAAVLLSNISQTNSLLRSLEENTAKKVDLNNIDESFQNLNRHVTGNLSSLIKEVNHKTVMNKDSIERVLRGHKKLSDKLSHQENELRTQTQQLRIQDDHNSAALNRTNDDIDVVINRLETLTSFVQRNLTRTVEQAKAQGFSNAAALQQLRQEELSDIKTNVSALSNQFEELGQRIENVVQEITTNFSDHQRLHNDDDSLKEDVRRLQHFIESDVSVNLSTLSHQIEEMAERIEHVLQQTATNFSDHMTKHEDDPLKETRRLYSQLASDFWLNITNMEHRIENIAQDTDNFLQESTNNLTAKVALFPLQLQQIQIELNKLKRNISTIANEVGERRTASDKADLVEEPFEELRKEFLLHKRNSSAMFEAVRQEVNEISQNITSVESSLKEQIDQKMLPAVNEENYHSDEEFHEETEDSYQETEEE